MIRILTLCLSLVVAISWTTTLSAQQVLKGNIQDDKGLPVSGASISLENTLDGTSSDSLGNFRLATTEKGEQMLVVSAIGYEAFRQLIRVETIGDAFRFKLRRVTNTLDQVSITAGSIGSVDGSQKTVLEPLDIVTTAGSGADPIAAMQMLPGVQRNGAQTGMMVRGGDASEAAILVDQMVLQNPFFSDVPGVQQRSRFGAFQFKGIAFSSGGYSARYGQAMSSVLEMNTLDLPEESTINLGMHMAGLYASGSKLFHDNKMSINATANYTNLSPFYGIATTNFDFDEVPKGGGGSLNYQWKTDKGGLLKVMGNFAKNQSGIRLPNPFLAGELMDFAIKNQNAYGQASYRQNFGDQLKWVTAASYSYNDDDTRWGNFPTQLSEHRGQLRSELTWFAASGLSIVAGTELQNIEVDRIFDTLRGAYTEQQYAGYVEGEWTPLHWLAFRPGLRYEHSVLLQTHTLAPRIAASIKTNKFSQISIAGGVFYQNPDKQYLLQAYRPGQQRAMHYIANFMYLKEDRTLRLEGYYKSYDQLVREHASGYDPNAYRLIYGTVDNSGSGYAQGLELFWRDKKTVKNLDYWLSYSYINTERLYKNYPVAATPDFISDHNLSVVGKYWIEKLSGMISGTYSYASGKPYYNPNTPAFLGNRTPDYHNLALQVSYLRTFGKWFTVFYLSVDNVTNAKNIFGYRYSMDGQDRYPIEPAMYRTVFAGINISLSKFDRDEL